MRTRLGRRETGIGALFLVTALLVPAHGLACGATPFSWALPTNEAGEIPAGTHELRVYQSEANSDTEHLTVKLQAMRGEQTADIPVTVRTEEPLLLVLDLGAQTIEAGVSYTLALSEAPNHGWLGFSDELSFVGGPALPVPDELGSLMLSPVERVSLLVGGCGDSTGRDGVEFTATLVPSATAEPWARGAVHQLLVDGKGAFTPELPLLDYLNKPAPLSVRAFAYCSEKMSSNGTLNEGVPLELKLGKHTLAWRSTFPDGTVLTTESSTVDFSCSGASGHALACSLHIGSEHGRAWLPLLALSLIRLGRRRARR